MVIAQAQVPNFAEEISTVAARLRDFHEPDAVFLIITLRDVVQVVARSATDEIDVGTITRTLGGGGHGRAAAAASTGAHPSRSATRSCALVTTRHAPPSPCAIS